MNKQELLKLLDIGENCELECKESKSQLSQSMWETYSAMANTNGGIILLGILEDKKTKEFTIDGINNIKNIQKTFWDTIHNKSKVSVNILNNEDVQLLKIDNMDILYITVPRANRTDKPVFINGNPLTGTFKRYHEGDYHATDKEIKVMFGDAVTEQKDLMEIDEFSIDNIDTETLESYRVRFRNDRGSEHPYSNLSDEEFLFNINAVNRESKHLTMAGLLMFGKEKDIIRIFHNYFLDYREIKNEKTTERWSHRIISADGLWAGNLWGFYSKIVNRLTADIEVPFVLNKDMQRIDDTDIHKSVREALANCLVHADYRESGTIVVIKGENYFKFANPGNLRIPLERAVLGGQSDPRNAILHQMFAYLGYGEKAGTGLPMIIKAWKEKGWVAPEIEEAFNPNRTTLILYMKQDSNYPDNYTNNYTDDYTDKLTQTQSKILAVVKLNPQIAIKDLAKEVGISEPGIKWNIKRLKERGKLDRKGTSRKGNWIII